MNHREYRYIVIGNGNQAAYGIDERIDSFAFSAAGLKKAKKLAMKWYKPATIIIKTPIGTCCIDSDIRDIDHDRVKQVYNID